MQQKIIKNFFLSVSSDFGDINYFVRARTVFDGMMSNQTCINTCWLVCSTYYEIYWPTFSISPLYNVNSNRIYVKGPLLDDAEALRGHHAWTGLGLRAAKWTHWGTIRVLLGTQEENGTRGATTKCWAFGPMRNSARITGRVLVTISFKI